MPLVQLPLGAGNANVLSSMVSHIEEGLMMLVCMIGSLAQESRGAL